MGAKEDNVMNLSSVGSVQRPFWRSYAVEDDARNTVYQNKSVGQNKNSLHLITQVASRKEALATKLVRTHRIVILQEAVVSRFLWCGSDHFAFASRLLLSPPFFKYLITTIVNYCSEKQLQSHSSWSVHILAKLFQQNPGLDAFLTGTSHWLDKTGNLASCSNVNTTVLLHHLHSKEIHCEIFPRILRGVWDKSEKVFRTKSSCTASYYPRKVGNRCWERPEGNLSIRYYTEVLGAGATPFHGLLHFPLTRTL